MLLAAQFASARLHFGTFGFTLLVRMLALLFFQNPMAFRVSALWMLEALPLDASEIWRAHPDTTKRHGVSYRIRRQQPKFECKEEFSPVQADA